MNLYHWEEITVVGRTFFCTWSKRRFVQDLRNTQSKICSKQMDKYCVTSIYSTKVITSNDLIDNEDYCLKDCHDYQLSWSGHSQHHSEWNKDGCRGKVCWYQSIDIDINVWPATITVLRTKRNCCQFAIFVLLNVKNVFISLQKLLCRVNHRVEFLHASFFTTQALKIP